MPDDSRSASEGTLRGRKSSAGDVFSEENRASYSDLIPVFPEAEREMR